MSPIPAMPVSPMVMYRREMCLLSGEVTCSYPDQLGAYAHLIHCVWLM